MDSVANVTALLAVDRLFFTNPGVPLGKLEARAMAAVDAGLASVLSL